MKHAGEAGGNIMPCEQLFRTHVADVVVGDLSFRFHTIDSLDDAIDFYVEIAPDDDDMIPYYTILWDSAKALGTHMAGMGDFWRGKRVLEFGCGFGLPSMVAASLGATVTATDYHPDNEAFFRGNLRLNNLEQVRYLNLDWRNPSLDGVFDVLLGSDVIYDDTMVAPLLTCVERYCASDGVFFLADPGRKTLESTVADLERLGFTHTLHTIDEVFVFEFRRREP